MTTSRTTPEPLARAVPRRSVMAGALSGLAAVSLAGSAAAAPEPRSRRAFRELEDLEVTSGVRLGVVAGRGRRAAITYRAGERFPMCSLFKTLLVAELLERHADDDAWWEHVVTFSPGDVVENSTVTGADPDGAMTRTELADAALRASDNTAGNLLLREIGGPAGLTAALRALGARQTRLDRWEPDLNAAVPGDPRDTSTPAEIHQLFGDALLGDRLSVLGQSRLRWWMLRSLTSAERLGAAMPPGAELADKTGAGSFGVVNDAGVAWIDGEPLTIAVMTRTDDPGAANRNDVVAAAGRIVVDTLI